MDFCPNINTTEQNSIPILLHSSGSLFSLDYIHGILFKPNYIPLMIYSNPTMNPLEFCLNYTPILSKPNYPVKKPDRTP